VEKKKNKNKLLNCIKLLFIQSYTNKRKKILSEIGIGNDVDSERTRRSNEVKRRIGTRKENHS
jgi:hypothetical protein